MGKKKTLQKPKPKPKPIIVNPGKMVRSSTNVLGQGNDPICLNCMYARILANFFFYVATENHKTIERSVNQMIDDWLYILNNYEYWDSQDHGINYIQHFGFNGDFDNVCRNIYENNDRNNKETYSKNDNTIVFYNNYNRLCSELNAIPVYTDILKDTNVTSLNEPLASKQASIQQCLTEISNQYVGCSCVFVPTLQIYLSLSRKNKLKTIITPLVDRGTPNAIVGHALVLKNRKEIKGIWHVLVKGSWGAMYEESVDGTWIPEGFLYPTIHHMFKLDYDDYPMRDDEDKDKDEHEDAAGITKRKRKHKPYKNGKKKTQKHKKQIRRF